MRPLRPAKACFSAIITAFLVLLSTSPAISSPIPIATPATPLPPHPTAIFKRSLGWDDGLIPLLVNDYTEYKWHQAGGVGNVQRKQLEGKLGLGGWLNPGVLPFDENQPIPIDPQSWSDGEPHVDVHPGNLDPVFEHQESWNY